MVEALLRRRGPRGAKAEDLQQVVAWAQQVQAEGEAIAQRSALRRSPRGAGKTSPRAKAAQARQRQKQQEQFTQRQRRSEMDRALLEGVVAGSIRLDVQEGQLLFVQAESWTRHLTPAAAAASPDGS